MIKVEELRIGNIVGFYKNPHQDLQCGIIKDITHDENDEYGFYVPEFSERVRLPVPAIASIPISKEWLLGFRLKKADSDIIVYGDGKGFIIQSYDGTEWFLTVNMKRINVKWVHKLQNLYYELQGKELTTKYHKKTNRIY